MTTIIIIMEKKNGTLSEQFQTQIRKL